VTGNSRRAGLGQPERLDGCNDKVSPFRPTQLSGITIAAERCLRRLAQGSRLYQRHCGIGSQAQELLLPSEAILEAPELRSARHYPNVKAARVADLICRRAWPSLPKCDVCEGHRGYQEGEGSRIPPLSTPKSRGCTWMIRDAHGPKSIQTLATEFLLALWKIEGKWISLAVHGGSWKA
jgi:hypothetical protein